MRAQKFVLIDESGKARGVFGIEREGAPVIEIIDSTVTSLPPSLKNGGMQKGPLPRGFLVRRPDPAPGRTVSGQILRRMRIPPGMRKSGTRSSIIHLRTFTKCGFYRLLD